MSDRPATSAPRPRRARPYRRIRRWARHTPNGTIAIDLIGAGLALVLSAVIIAVIAL